MVLPGLGTQVRNGDGAVNLLKGVRRAPLDATLQILSSVPPEKVTAVNIQGNYGTNIQFCSRITKAA